MNIRLLPFELPFILPPTELLIIESLFLLVVFICCALIFYKTNIVFTLTEHKGVKYFRSIFLHFGLAYVFRLFHFFLLGLEQYANTPIPDILLQLNLFFVSYFSTMALFSLFMTILAKFRSVESTYHHVLIHGTSIAFAIFFFFTQSIKILLLFHTILILFCLVLFPIAYVRGHRKKVFNQNSLTYVALIAFWAMSLVTFSQQATSLLFKITLYVVSASIFIWITVRVSRRLSLNGKKA